MSTDWVETEYCRISLAPQGSAAWHELRNQGDYLTASRVGYAAGMMDRYKTAHQYAYELVTGAKEKFSPEARKRMNLGNEFEPALRDLYSRMYGVTVEQIGLAVSKRDPRLACSPDGLVGTEGLVEFKYVHTLSADLRSAAFSTVTDCDHILGGYACQIQQQLFVMGRQWCDFVVYAYSTKELYVERVPFRPELWAQICAKVEHFRAVIVPEVRANLDQYRLQYGHLYLP